MALQSVKISEATRLERIESPASILIPVSAGSEVPYSLTVEVLEEHLLSRVPGTIEVKELQEVVDVLTGDSETEGSIQFQIQEAKNDLIGTSEDTSSHNTINAAKNLVAESLQFITYN